MDTFLPTLKQATALRNPALRLPSQIQFMDLGTAWIRYRMVGSKGPTIVLNTDPPLTIESYDETIRELSLYFRVVVFEIPGFGFSFPKKLNFRYDFDSITQTLIRFLENLKLGPYILSFPCLLGFCSIKIANLCPELVSHVVLNQVPTWQGALAWKKGRSTRGILDIPILGQIALNILKEKRIDSWFELVVAEPEVAKRLSATVRSAYKLGACFSLASCFQFYLVDHPPDLEPVRQPSLIIWGECDGSHRQTDKSLTHQLILAGEEIYIPNAGHSPEVETPKIFAESVRTLLA